MSTASQTNKKLTEMYYYRTITFNYYISWNKIKKQKQIQIAEKGMLKSTWEKKK